ncbi:MAG: BrnT family toxin, partial [Nitrospirae bacterium]|nr:BrnT family toxin [Nitrospirota bacterium]
MKVVWDINKASENLVKHKIEFSHAATVLDDPLAITIEDERHEEKRFITLGADLLGRILVVVYAY